MSLDFFEIVGYVMICIGCLLGAALALIVILFFTTSVTVKAEYDGEVRFNFKYLFFSIAKSPESPSEIRRKKRRELKRREKEKKRRLKELRKREKLRRKNRKAEHLKTHEKKASSKSDAVRKSAASAKGVSSGAGGSGAEQGAETQRTDAQKTDDQKAGANESKPQAAAKAKNDKKDKADFQTVMRVLSTAKPHIKKLFKKIRITDVLVDIMVGGDDAAKTAVSYGVHCSAVYGFVEFLKQTVTFKADRITIKADFDLPQTDYYARAKVKLKVSVFLRCLLWGFSAVAKELSGSSSNSGKQENNKKRPLKKAG